MPSIGRIRSSSMQTPTTTTRAPRGASRMICSSSPGTPTHSKITAAAAARATSRQASIAGRCAGSIDHVRADAAPRARGASARSRRRRSARRRAASSAAITARPTGPQPITSGASPGSRRGLRDRVQPDGHRLGQRRVLGRRARSAPAAAASRRAPSARRSRRDTRSSSRRPAMPRRAHSERHRDDTRAPAARRLRACPARSRGSRRRTRGPSRRRAPRSITNGAPDSRADSTSLSACLSACRSEPQMPQASVLTSTSPGPGSGSGTVSTTRLACFASRPRACGGPNTAGRRRVKSVRAPAYDVLSCGRRRAATFHC